MLGTDLPCDMASPEPWDELVAAAGAEAARRIAGENAVELFGLRVTETAAAP